MLKMLYTITFNVTSSHCLPLHLILLNSSSSVALHCLQIMINSSGVVQAYADEHYVHLHKLVLLHYYQPVCDNMIDPDRQVVLLARTLP